ncbi:MAG: NAD(P)/FAD-dependent oxidoreductase [Lachnospiraceae bacterium]|nr:NAD(P)/FAD-dependent oxidoreductase [Lachnospiraceae bacterium]
MPDNAGRYDIAVIGGGAAGMMAGITALERGRSAVIIEKNGKLGKKLFLTGKGRCNLTNACPEDELRRHIVSNEKFMYSSLKRFSNTDVMDFFRESGLKIKTERGGRVFPESDHSSDVIRVLEKRLRAGGADIRLNTRAVKLLTENGKCVGVTVSGEDGKEYDISTESVIVATGGLSYPSTGSTGDGYRFAADQGISVGELSPSLVPLEIKGDICRRLQGLSLKNVRIAVKDGNKTIFHSKDTGEMLFTHFGVSGPLILTASSEIPPEAYRRDLKLYIDLKPALGVEELDQRVQRDFREAMNREYRNSLSKLLPSSLIPVMVEVTRTDPDKKVNSVTKEERSRLVNSLKAFELEIKGTRGFEEAVITKGGISVKETDPKTLGSKKVGGLYFAGEVLDVDAHTGGFNLQIAWSTGYAAGSFA